MRPNQMIPDPEVIISTIPGSMTRDKMRSQGSPARPEPVNLKTLRSAEETSRDQEIIAQRGDMLTSLSTCR